MRTLHLVLGDQLDATSAFFEDVGENEPVLLLELDQEATFVRQHKHRLVLFFSAMRHFAGERVEVVVREAQDAKAETEQRLEYLKAHPPPPPRPKPTSKVFTGFGADPNSAVPLTAQLRQAMSAASVRAIDVFREWCVARQAHS